MECFVGIDLGTSSVRAIAVNPKGRTVAAGQCEYDILKPALNQAEQDMEKLWQAAVLAIRQMLSADKGLADRIRGIGFSGQMHGLVMLDAEARLIRNAIIWADQRSGPQIEKIYRVIPREQFGEIYCNKLSTGFLLPSLLWVREHEPQNYEKVRKVLLPKDYIRYRICGELGTDASDASGTGMWDMKRRDWAYGLLEKLDILRDMMTVSRESYGQAGVVTKECARETGLRAGTFVAYGGGDSLMMELGNGMIRSGRMASTIGTACHLTCALEKPLYDTKLRTNTWCHGEEGLWSIMGAHLSGGVALKWLKNQILRFKDFDTMTEEAEAVPAGSEGMLFLPYLNGERTPHNDPDARAVYLGMTLKHTRAHMIRSTMEGIVYSMKESYAIFQSLGIRAQRMIAAGGGANSRLFRQLQADMYQCPIYRNQGNEQAGLGAAMTAAVGCGYFRNYEEACESMVHLSSQVTEPISANVKRYEEEFLRFKEIYHANKRLF
ncbi:MAG: xylulokinase [Dorea sp.]|uniref:xylulokinase n=1 Tax=Sporofaciens musculi TaxID=2681861 RepID=UPI00216CD9A1|nr:xylulokinase [Sporofaciens musculi]MCI9421527.1 xylulokinase [Dorea sp.]